MPAGKSRTGNFFEDFHVGQRIAHSTRRTLSEGDRSAYIGLTGSREVLYSAATVAALAGLPGQPMDPMLVFNVAFGKTVPDISLNAVANLGYADLRFLMPVYAGDTIAVDSEIIGLRETSTGRSGVVYTRSVACRQDGAPVLQWIRWVLVHKRGTVASTHAGHLPDLPAQVAQHELVIPPFGSDVGSVAAYTGSADFWEDYAVGERIDHPGAMTLNDSDHSIATRLYQNTAKVHFDAHRMRAAPGGSRLVYGGHVISVCKALAYDGLENALSIVAIHAGTHVNPCHAGDTLRCATQVLERIDLGHPSLAALRLRMCGAKNLDDAAQIEFPLRDGTAGAPQISTVLDIDYVAVIPRRPSV
jgi:2-methylfumaryl-CoA hydratase